MTTSKRQRARRKVPPVVRLSRCPFCGSLARIEQRGIWYSAHCGGAMSVSPRPTRDCAECEVQPRTPWSLSVDDAARMWNKRPNNGLNHTDKEDK